MAESPEIVELKQKGNAAHQAGDFRAAIYFFSMALEKNENSDNSPVLYSNRSASYCMLEDYTRALDDANTVIRMKPQWAKGYSRLGLAMHRLKKYEEAIEAYEMGLKLEPENDLIKKGLSSVKVAQSHNSFQVYEPASVLTNERQHEVEGMANLTKLAHVRWHLAVFHDRIWLADPPFAPFRPRSIFIFDSVRLQMLGMSPHTTRDPISVDELMDFLAKTCGSHNIRPAVLEISDARLFKMTREHIKIADIVPSLVPLNDEEQTLLRETVKGFDEREQEQWKQNNKFVGVLKQRKQVGLLEMPNVTPAFLKYFLDAATKFYDSRSYLYLPLPVGVRIGGGEMKVMTVARNEQGVFGLKVWKERKGPEPPVCLYSMLFHDMSNIPFFDADDFERYGWTTAEGKYPFPIMGEDIEESRRPTRDVLAWWEAALRAVNLSVKHTTAEPTFVVPEHSEGATYKCQVHTLGALTDVVVSCPPSSTSTTIDATFKEPPQGEPRIRLSHEEDGETSVKDTVATATTTTPVATPTPSSTPAAPKPAPKQLAPKHDSPAAPEPAQASSYASPNVTLPTGDGKWRKEQATLEEYKRGWVAEQISREGLLHHLSGLLIDSPGNGPDLREEHSQQQLTVQRLNAEVELLKSKCEFQQQQLSSQADFINQLQAHIEEVEMSEQTLRAQLDEEQSTQGGNMAIIDVLSTSAKATLTALSNTQDDFKRWIDVVNSDTTIQRQKNLERLGRGPKPESMKTLETKVSGSKKALQKTFEGKAPTKPGPAPADRSAPAPAPAPTRAPAPKVPEQTERPDLDQPDRPSEPKHLASTLNADYGSNPKQSALYGPLRPPSPANQWAYNASHMLLKLAASCNQPTTALAQMQVRHMDNPQLHL